MKTTEYIRTALETSKIITFTLIDDMKNAPLTQPTSKGGNHPLWVLGHLIYSESNLLNSVVLGNENPLSQWEDVFGGGSEPTSQAADYPAWDEVRAKFDEVRDQTINFLGGLTDDDLDQPSKNCPPGREQFMGTVGSCLLLLTLHPALHRGQVADARRMKDRKPLIA